MIPARIQLLFIVAAMAIPAPAALAATNIDIFATGQKYGWTENGGWLNMQGDIANGVRLGSTTLSGYAWHENFGWINFGTGSPEGNHYSNVSPDDFGVNIDPVGNLFGYAWGENIGWINFGAEAPGGFRVRVDKPSGRFSGYAWGENIGWLAFETVNPAHVATAPGYARASDWTLY